MSKNLTIWMMSLNTLNFAGKFNILNNLILFLQSYSMQVYLSYKSKIVFVVVLFLWGVAVLDHDSHPYHNMGPDPSTLGAQVPKSIPVIDPNHTIRIMDKIIYEKLMYTSTKFLMLILG